MTEVTFDLKSELNEKDIEKAMIDKLEKILLEVMLAVESHAKDLAPVDTGVLRASIHTIPRSPAPVIKVSDGVSYGVFQEYGTMKMKAQPFLRPAVDMALNSDLPRIVKKYDKK